MADLYEVLQVHRRAELDVIRAAYRALARKHHPDFGGDGARMVAINDAWRVLSDNEARAVYDAQLAKSHNRRATDRMVP
ncbi:MAG: J domain-containing protein, partial [Candidatus Limnocylindrales bacterium]